MIGEIIITTAEKIDIYSEMKARLEELQKAFEVQNAELIEAINDLRAEIEADVLDKGETVRGETMMAVWNRGKTTWDGKQLKELAKQYPIAVASKVGSPTVSFRAIREEYE